MDIGLVKVTPDKEKAKSSLRMADTTLEMIKEIDIARFPSNVTREYYDVIREMISIILQLDGYKTFGEEAHKRQIEYLAKNYTAFSAYDISIMDDLRILRNRISYDSFFVQEDYIRRNAKQFERIIRLLKAVIIEKIKGTDSG